VKSQKLNGLQKEVDSLLELCPNRENMTELKVQLRTLEETRETAFSEAQRLFEAQDYEGCLSELAKIDKSLLVENIVALREQAETKRQEQNAAAHFSEAQRLFEAQDYEGCLSELEKIPKSLLVEEIVALREQAETTINRLKKLGRTIRAAVKKEELHGLLEQVEEYLSLKRTDQDVVKLQDQLIERDRAELDTQREKAESLRNEYAFDESLRIAREIAAVEDSRLQHLKEWSETFIDETETEKVRQEQNAANHYAEAKTHRKAYDYKSAIHAMEAIPEAMRTSGMSSYLQQLQSDHDESEELIATISDRVKRSDLKGLLEPVERAVKLRGDHADLLKLHTQLNERLEKLIKQRDAAYTEASSLLNEGQAKKAYRLICRVKTQDLRASDVKLRTQLEEIVAAEDALTALVEESKADGVLDPAEVAAMWKSTDEYLKLNPRHEKIAEMQQQLVDRIERAPAEYAAVLQQSLGDQSTFGGGDAGGNDEPFDDDMEVVDLSERYTIEGVLGKGGMGEVLLATDTFLKRKVAIKRVLGTMAKSKTAVRRFLTEAKSIAALNHPNIVQIYDYGRAADGPFLTMEYVDGGSLLEKCKEGALELEEAVELTCQLCDGLGKAHEAGIIHRDIKPANVLLTKDGTPKLTDFGLARQDLVASAAKVGLVLGTIDFMPPEQRRGATETDARSDLWSLAATLYQMVTGKSPKIIKFNNVPQALQDVLGKALEDEKDDRYQTAAEFRDALRASQKAQTAPAPVGDADLDEGVCSKCHTKNDLKRKFCRECAESLEVAVDLGAGECPTCHTKNEATRKFCRECGASL
jgi:hypothetical protein